MKTKYAHVVLWVAAALLICCRTDVRAGSNEKAPAELVKKIQAAGDLTAHPDANSILIESRASYEYGRDGKFSASIYGLRKILTEQGKKDQGEQRFPYYRKYDRIAILQARVIKPDGTVLDVPEKSITDITLAALAAMNIFEPEQREKVVTFPNLEAGDTIEFSVVDSCFRTPMDSTFDFMHFFQEFDPILHNEVVVTGPKSMPLRHKCQNDPNRKIQFTTRETGDRTIYRWWADNQERLVAEPAMASVVNILPSVWASTIQSWKDISRWGYRLNEPYIDMNDALKTEVANLIRNCATQDDTIKALYHFVAQNVRYMGVELGKKTGFDPKPATQTYANKYGVCRDVAVLLTAMLREVQIPANVVYTAAGYEMYSDIPNLFWSHAIVAVPRPGGGVVYADPTVPNGIDLLMSVEAEQVTLILRAEGDSLAKTPYSPPEDNSGRFTATTELRNDGSVSSRIRFETDGIYDLVIRKIVKAMPAAQLKNVYQQVAVSVFPGAQIVDIKTGDPEDLYHPMTLDLVFECPDFALQAGKYLLVKMPFSTPVFDLIGNQFIQAASLTERKTPFNLQTTLGTIREETLIIPKGYRIKAVPDPIDLSRNAMAYKTEYKKGRTAEPDGKASVQCTSLLAFRKKIYSPADYLEMKDVLKASQKSVRSEIILEKTP